MSNSSPLIEEQHRFARSQTPESPRPVHVPEPANIPILRNQMDPVFNDTTTYNIPSDQNFSHYGETLENPNYKTTPMEENMDFKTFFLAAENQVALPQLPSISSEPNANISLAENLAASTKNANLSGLSSHADRAELDPQANTAQSFGPSHLEVANGGQDDEEMREAADLGDVHLNPTGPGIIDSTDTDKNATAGTRPRDGVDYQSLLDTISQSASTAPAADSVIALTTEPSVSDPSLTSTLPSFPGLPPKPPPLQTQSAPGFSSSHDLAQYAQQPNTAGASQNSLLASSSGYDFSTNGITSSTGNSDHVDHAISNPFDVGITNEQAIAMHMQNNQSNPKPLSPTSRNALEDSDRPWSPKTQAIFDAFLEDERRYVTEGIWDRFPLGSRLFLGNLPSEKVTKRDLFHRFHRFGKLAQISIKQAYGFVQYHDASSCKAALDAEQGVELRGRKVHLEISKPQKNTKGAGTSNSKPQQTQPPSQNRRRSRSPVRRSYPDYREEPSRRREEYRDRRSPSPPRGYRRDDRTSSRTGPRSPAYGSNHGYSIPQVTYDDEAGLPYPRRDPRNVPDVQLIVVDTVDQAFINWIEDGFKRKGLQAATTWLNQRTPLQAVVKRQIVEGVQAVVKVSSSHQIRSKIPLEVFDRGGGSSNVSFNEYADLDVSVAADVVLQARRRERGGLQPPLPPQPQYPPTAYPPQSSYQISPNTSTGTPSPWGPPAPPQFPPPQHLHQYQQAQQAQQSQQPQQQNYRPPQSPFTNTPQSATGHPPNLQDLLANLKGGTAPPTPQSAHSAGQPHTPYGQPQQFSYGPPQPPQFGQYQQPPAQQQAGQPHNVQHIMDQLARYQR